MIPISNKSCIVGKLANHNAPETCRKRCANVLDDHLLITDATPAIQSALQNLRQQYTNKDTKFDTSSKVKVLQFPTQKMRKHVTDAKTLAIIESKRSIDLPSTLVPFSFPPTSSTKQTEVSTQERSILPNLDLVSSVLPLEEESSLHDPAVSSTLSWHTPTMTHTDKSFAVNSLLTTRPRGSFQTAPHGRQGLPNHIEFSTENATITNSGNILYNDTAKNKYQELMDKNYCDMKEDQQSRFKMLDSIDLLSGVAGYGSLPAPMATEQNSAFGKPKKGNSDIHMTYNLISKPFIKSGSLCSNLHDDLNSSFSSSVTTGSTIGELPITPTSSSPVHAHESIFNYLNHCSADSINDECSPSSDINVSLIENFENQDYDMEDPINEDIFIPTTELEDTVNSSFDLPLCSHTTRSSVQHTSTPTSEIACSIGSNNVRIGDSIHFIPPIDHGFTMETNLDNAFNSINYRSKQSGFTYKSLKKSTISISPEGQSTSPIDYAGFGSYSVPSTESSTQSPINLNSHVQKINENPHLFLPNSMTLEHIPDSFPSSSSALQVLNPSDKSLNHLQVSELKAVTLPAFLNETFISNTNDKRHSCTSTDLGSNIFNNAGVNLLPSLDHPLDFENLMDLDNLPFEK